MRLAKERIDLPKVRLWLNYQSDADVLWIGLKEHPRLTRSEDDMEKGLIFNYEGQELVSIEVLDLYGVFAH